MPFRIPKNLLTLEPQLIKTRLQDRVRTLSSEYRQQQHQTSQRRKNLRTRVNKLKAETIAANASSTSNPVTKIQLKMLSKHYAKQVTTLVKKVLRGKLILFNIFFL